MARKRRKQTSSRAVSRTPRKKSVARSALAKAQPRENGRFVSRSTVESRSNVADVVEPVVEVTSVQDAHEHRLAAIDDELSRLHQEIYENPKQDLRDRSILEQSMKRRERKLRPFS